MRETMIPYQVLECVCSWVLFASRLHNKSVCASGEGG